MTVGEWVRSQRKAATELFAPATPADGIVEPELPPRNPFKRKHWNLTEQMRLQRTDPERAAKLKREAWDAEA